MTPRRFQSIWVPLFVWLFTQALAPGDDGSLLRVPLSSNPSAVIVEVEFGQKRCSMLVDTAAGMTSIGEVDPEIVVGPSGTVTVSEANRNKIRTLTYSLRPLTIQSLSVPSPVASIVDIKNARLFTGVSLTGILGLPELSRGKVLVDFKEGLFEVHQGEWRLDLVGAQAVQLDGSSELPVFSAKILGRTTSMIVDTGYNGCIALSAWLFRALLSDGHIKLSDVPGRAVVASGVGAQRKGVFLAGELMGKNLRGVKVVEQERLEGIVGLQWLCGFRTELDMSERKMRYEQWKEAPLPIEAQLMLGAVLVFEDGRARVNRLRPGGGAVEAAGLQEGCIVHRFGSLTVGMFNDANIINEVKRNAGKPVPIRFLKPNGDACEGIVQLPKPQSPWRVPVD